MNIEWRICTLNENYEVSNDGQVRRAIDGRVLKQDDLRGYRGVKFFMGTGFHKRHLVHRLVAEAFLLPDECRNIINHKNGIRHDNRIDNLEWCTGSENERHKYDVLKRNGPLLGKKGYDHHCSKEVIATSPCGFAVLVFGSGAEAARHLGLPSGAVPRVCSGEYSHYRGWNFQYT